MMIYLIVTQASLAEREALDSGVNFTLIVALLAAAAAALCWSATKLERSPEGALQFEETAEPAVLLLNLEKGDRRI